MGSRLVEDGRQLLVQDLAVLGGHFLVRNASEFVRPLKLLRIRRTKRADLAIQSGL
jgi:hypothetical protein